MPRKRDMNTPPDVHERAADLAAQLVARAQAGEPPDDTAYYEERLEDTSLLDHAVLTSRCELAVPMTAITPGR